MSLYTVAVSQLSGTGSSAAFQTSSCIQHTWQVKYAPGLTASTVIQILGSLDGTNFGTMRLDNTTVAGVAIAQNQATLTGTGTYLLNARDFPVTQQKIQYVSSSGAVGATVDVVYIGQ